MIRHPPDWFDQREDEAVDYFVNQAVHRLGLPVPVPMVYRRYKRGRAGQQVQRVGYNVRYAPRQFGGAVPRRVVRRVAEEKEDMPAVQGNMLVRAPRIHMRRGRRGQAIGYRNMVHTSEKTGHVVVSNAPPKASRLIKPEKVVLFGTRLAHVTPFHDSALGQYSSFHDLCPNNFNGQDITTGLFGATPSMPRQGVQKNQRLKSEINVESWRIDVQFQGGFTLSGIDATWGCTNDPMEVRFIIIQVLGDALELSALPVNFGVDELMKDATWTVDQQWKSNRENAPFVVPKEYKILHDEKFIVGLNTIVKKTVQFRKMMWRLTEDSLSSTLSNHRFYYTCFSPPRGGQWSAAEQVNLTFNHKVVWSDA